MISSAGEGWCLWVELGDELFDALGDVVARAADFFYGAALGSGRPQSR